MPADKNKQWSGRTDGTPWMHRTLIAMLRVVDVRVFYAIMALVIPFYMLFNRKGYRAMRDYFKHCGQCGLRMVWHIYRNHYTFGQVVIDRFAVYAGKKFSFVEDGHDLITSHSEMDGGFIMLSSHVGNYELTGCTFDAYKKRINALVYAGEGEAIMNSRKQILEKHNIGLIPVGEGMSHIFQMNAAIDKGEVISMHADRLFGSMKHITCRFLGEDANFPVGPFAFAAQKNVPIYAMFCMKEGAKTYHLYVRPIEYGGDGNIRSRIDGLAKRYVEVLEEMVNKYPYQWFNYFDFWQDCVGKQPPTKNTRENRDATRASKFQVNLSDILPQRPPFVMIDGIKHCEENAIETFFEIKKDCVFCDEHGFFSEAGMIENIAQTCAARIGYITLKKGGEVKIGMIGAVTNLTIDAKPKAGEMIQTKVWLEEDIFNMTLVRSEITVGEKLIATGKMKIALSDKKAE